ncbi:helix-turn-helix transcriptional regulator [Variovorax sp. KK3]|uniref:ArsR/SmtB family transcription factor n=1 Tax=Variovorax sp. KK3 TaxID=1855728 RepID=UPI00097CB9B5|nr:helix-turn-helix transcriptional regulator [Variovorax sp. KK3]
MPPAVKRSSRPHVPAQVALDAVFGALSHRVRRETLDALGAGAQSLTTLAAPHAMTLAAFMKHVRMLEDAGLIACTKQGRSRICALVEQPLDPAAAWIDERRRMWNDRLDALGRHLYHQAQIGDSRPRPSPASPARKAPVARRAPARADRVVTKRTTKGKKP